MFDVTKTESPAFFAYLNTHSVTNSVSPEGLQFVHATQSPDGQSYLLVGYDTSNSIEAWTVAVPEPTGLTTLLSGLITMFGGRIRRLRTHDAATRAVLQSSVAASH